MLAARGLFYLLVPLIFLANLVPKSYGFNLTNPRCFFITLIF